MCVSDYSREMDRGGRETPGGRKIKRRKLNEEWVASMSSTVSIRKTKQQQKRKRKSNKGGERENSVLLFCERERTNDDDDGVEERKKNREMWAELTCIHTHSHRHTLKHTLSCFGMILILGIL